MSVSAQAVDLRIEPDGSSLVGDHAAGVTSVTVKDATPFDTDGGEVTINGSVYAWTSVTEVDDPDESGETNAVLAISPALVADASDLMPVTKWSGEQELSNAVLVMDDDTPITLTANQRPYWSSREDNFGPPVQVTLSDDLTLLEDAPGWTPTVDSRTLSAIGVPPPADGVAPAAPTLTVQSGPGFIAALVSPPTTNADGDPQADSVRFNIYGADTEAGVTIDPTKLVAQGPEILKSLRAFLDGTPLDFTDIDGNAKPYFFAATAVDNDGESELSPVVSAAMGKIDASAYVVLGTVVADLLASRMSLSSLFTTRGQDADGNSVGQGVELGPTGLYGYRANDTPRFGFPTDDTLALFMQGNAELDYASALQLLVAQALTLAQAGVLTLQSAIVPPSSPPVVQIDYATRQFTADGHWDDRKGWSTDGTYWYTARAHGVQVIAERWTSSGTLNASYAVTFSNTMTVTGSCVGPGGDFYVIANTGVAWAVYQFTASTMNYLHTNILSGSGTTAQEPDGYSRGCALGFDPVTGELLIAQARPTNSDKVRIRRYTPTTGSLFGTWGSFLDTDFAYAQSLSYILISVGGDGGFPATRYLFGNYAAASRVVSTGGTRQTDDEWPDATGGSIRGMGWSGTNFVVMDAAGTAFTYENRAGNRWTTATDATWYVANNLTNGAAHTPVGPIATFTMKKRARLTITAPALPPGVPGADIFLAKGATPPTAGSASMKKQAAGSGTPPALVVTNADFSTSDNPTTNTFGSGTPAKAQSASGNSFFDGADGFRWGSHYSDAASGNTKIGANGTPIAVVREGVTTANTDASGQVTVTHGLGTTPVRVAINKRGGGSRRIDWQTESSTTFTVQVREADGTATASGQSVTFAWRCSA